jgi:hypothetical protein
LGNRDGPLARTAADRGADADRIRRIVHRADWRQRNPPLGMPAKMAGYGFAEPALRVTGGSFSQTSRAGRRVDAVGRISASVIRRYAGRDGGLRLRLKCPTNYGASSSLRATYLDITTHISVVFKLLDSIYKSSVTSAALSTGIRTGIVTSC